MTKSTPVLLVDCVTWAPVYDRSHSLANVGGWFRTVWGDDVHPLEVVHAEAKALPKVANYAGIVISGSPASAYEDLPWIRRLEGVVRECVERNIPLLGVCFGHQVVAQALGGTVERNPRGWEIGDPDIELTEAGQADPLFDGVPARFSAIQSHQDIVTELPEGAVQLSRSALCEQQGFALGNNVRTVQFHPEMGPEHLKFILPPRRERILESSGVDVLEVLSSVQDTPAARKVLTNFRDRFIAD